MTDFGEEKQRRPDVQVRGVAPAKQGSRRTVQKKKGGRIVLRTDAFEIELDLPDLVLAQIERLFERGER
ncbi:MAG: hypothetical protein ACRD0K_10095 [Egibacteraceae bacterium]